MSVWEPRSRYGLNEQKTRKGDKERAFTGNIVSFPLGYNPPSIRHRHALCVVMSFPVWLRPHSLAALLHKPCSWSIASSSPSFHLFCVVMWWISAWALPSNGDGRVHDDITNEQDDNISVGSGTQGKASWCTRFQPAIIGLPSTRYQ